MDRQIPRAIHWDYADNFSGRDAAYLIAGLDPSSNNAEDAYRVQPIIQKLKDAYYLACSELWRDMESEREGGTQWSWLHQHRYKKEELLSVKQQKMISNFMTSKFVKDGHLKILEGFQRESATFDSAHEFPELELLASARMELEAAQTTLYEYLEKFHTHTYLKWKDTKKRLKEERARLESQKIPWRQFLDTKAQLEPELDRLRAELKEKAAVDAPELANEVDRLFEKWNELDKRKSDWIDAKRIEAYTYYEQHRHLHTAAADEGNTWLSRYIHEFDDEKFSRTELCRWLSDNHYQTDYTFSSKAPKDDKPVTTNERNTLLVLIAALCAKAEIDPKGRGAASQLVRLASLETGVQLDDGTVLSKLKQIPDAIGARRK
jgi:hypothetical protein